MTQFACLFTGNLLSLGLVNCLKRHNCIDKQQFIGKVEYHTALISS